MIPLEDISMHHIVRPCRGRLSTAWTSSFARKSFCTIQTPTTKNIEIRLVTPADKEPLIDFLKYHLPRHGTPVMLSLGFTPDEIEHVARRKAHAAFQLPEKTISYLAMDKSTDAITAIFTGYIVDPSSNQSSSVTAEFKPMTPIRAKFQQYNDFHRLIESGLEEFLPHSHTRTPYLVIDLALSNPTYRKLGLAEKMFDMAYERGWMKFGCKYGFSICTSFKAQKLCEKHGWVTLRWIRYEDYYANGKRVFK